jgi:hypothetical protein
MIGAQGNRFKLEFSNSWNMRQLDFEPAKRNLEGRGGLKYDFRRAETLSLLEQILVH